MTGVQTCALPILGYAGSIVYDSSKPDGTPRKLMDVGLMRAAGWVASTPLDAGLAVAYAEFARSNAAAPPA